MHAFEKKPIIHRNFISQLLCLQCSHISYMHIYNIFSQRLDLYLMEQMQWIPYDSETKKMD